MPPLNLSVMAFSGNSKVFASVSSEIIYLWNTADWTLQAELDVHPYFCLTLLLSDGKLLLSGSCDGEAQFWDSDMLILQENSILRRSSSESKNITRTPASLQSCSVAGYSNFHFRVVDTARFSLNGKLIACIFSDVLSDGPIQIRDSATWNLQQTLKYPSNHAKILAFSRYSDILVLGSALRSIEIWRCNTGAGLTGTEQNAFDECHNIKDSFPWKLCKSLPNTIEEWLVKKSFPGFSEVSALVVLPNSKFIAGQAANQQLVIYDTSTGKHSFLLHSIYMASVHETSPNSNSLAFSPDSKILVVASYRGTVYLWDIRALKDLIQTSMCLSDSIVVVALSSNDQIAASVSSSNNIDIWYRSRHCDPAWVHSQILKGRSRSFCVLAFSYDGTILVTGSPDECIMIWCSGIEDSHPRILQQALLDGVEKPVVALEISSGGSIIMGVVSNTINIWRRTENQPPRWILTNTLPMPKHFRSTNVVVLSPDGNYIAAGFDKGLIMI